MRPYCVRTAIPHRAALPAALSALGTPPDTVDPGDKHNIIATH